MSSELTDANLKLKWNAAELISGICQPRTVEAAFSKSRGPEAENRNVNIKGMQQTVKRSQRIAPRRVVILAVYRIVLRIFIGEFEERTGLLEVVEPVVMKLVDESRGKLIRIAWHAAYERARQFRAADTPEIPVASRLERDRPNRMTEMSKRRGLESCYRR